jgi:hypothetical protein
MNRPGLWFRPTPLLLVTALLACGGGNDPSGPVTGSLAVAVSGLPGGASAAVSISGPGGFARALTGSQTISNLAPGGYSLTASNVNYGGSAYAPTPVSQSVTVSEGDTPTAATVTYETVTAGLTVTIDGLPSGTSADVTVTGPGGFSQTITGTQTFSNLTPGTYTINANSVSSAGTDYSPAPASQTAAVATGSVASATVTYSVVVPGALNLKIDGMYLTQSVQTYSGTVPLVKDRNGYLRVFVTANQSNVAQPAVRVRFYNGLTLVQTTTIPAPGLSTPLSPDESSLSKSWNVAVPGSLIQPNLKILADVDPTNTVVEANEGDNNFPSSGLALGMNVQTTSTFSVRFVPVQVAGRVGNVSSANKDQFLTETMKMHPLAGYDADVRAQYNSSAPALDAKTSSTWTTVLNEITALRTSDPDGSSRYYFGVVNPNYSTGIAGIGWVPGQSAIGWDKLPSASSVAAHEWGHNWGRQHAPTCNNPSNPDANYPYANGLTGVYGLDVATVTLKPPSYSDVMGYCDPEWISDYTYKGVMDYRSANADVTSAFSQAMQSCLLVWGRIENGQIILEPAFEVVTRPSLPASGGEYTVEGRGPDGSRIFSLPFAPSEIADLPGEHEQFAFAIPLSADHAARLTTLRLTGRGREVISQSRGALPQTGARVAPVVVRRTATGQVALQWDAVTHPMLLVRDGTTGQIISFARGGSVQLPGKHQELSVGFSNGVRSTEMRVVVPSR